MIKLTKPFAKILVNIKIWVLQLFGPPARKCNSEPLNLNNSSICLYRVYSRFWL